MKISAAVVDEHDGPFTIETVDLDEPGPGEVLVELVATGICHTDGLARHEDLLFPLPGVLGHEGAGVVSAVGPPSPAAAGSVTADPRFTDRPALRCTATSSGSRPSPVTPSRPRPPWSRSPTRCRWS